MHFVPLHNPYDMPARSERYRRMIETNVELANALWQMVITYREGQAHPYDEPSMVCDAIKVLRSVGHDECIRRYGERD